jgi:diguanylate cyclase (GGDEF)-like protein
MFNDRLQRAIAQAESTGRGAGVAMLDLDHFRTINDRLGVDADDRVLVLIAQRLRDALRDQDTVARLGGDRFALVLADVSHGEALQRIGRAGCSPPSARRARSTSASSSSRRASASRAVRAMATRCRTRPGAGQRGGRLIRPSILPPSAIALACQFRHAGSARCSRGVSVRRKLASHDASCIRAAERDLWQRRQASSTRRPCSPGAR